MSVKLLVISSALDLRLPYSCTPAWWLLLRALALAGVDLVVVPYAGTAVDTPWWRAYDNPCKVEGDLVALAKRGAKRFRSSRPRHQSSREGGLDRLTRGLAQAWVRPKWERHLGRVLQREAGVDAVLVLTVPLNQIAGLPTTIEKRFGIPCFYYDGDIPASLPNRAGFQSGFRIYQGAQLSEYAAFFSNSKGGVPLLLELGARKVHTLYYAADASVRPSRQPVQDIDVFFYGHGSEYREQWIHSMLTSPSNRLPKARFAARGLNLGSDLGRTEVVPYLSFAHLRSYCSRSKINLLINRDSHASVYASSTSRPFELAALGSCIVSNPYAGIEEWFEPKKEVVIVEHEDEVVEQYSWLLTHPEHRRRLGAAALRRVRSEHTYEHRAMQLLTTLVAEGAGT